MTQEQMNVKNVFPDTKPMGWGYTIIVRAMNIEGVKLLDKVKEIWEVAASWGRFMDEELGDWPSLAECLEQLPSWFRHLLQNDPDTAENWTERLHDRDWAWWSSYHFNDYIKIDLQLESLPTSFWPLKFAIEKVGGVIVYEGAWIETQEMKRRIQAGEIV